MTTNSELLIISDHGIYIPQLFAEEYADKIMNEKQFQEDIDILLLGPKEEWYNDAWCNVLDQSTIKDDEGKEFFLWQNDGDLWAIPETDRDEFNKAIDDY